MTAYQPDILANELDVVFCGINPASTAVADGHNFSSPTNRFWAAIHLAGFTDRRLSPKDERELLQFGCGITAVVERATERASQVTTGEFRRARPAFESKIRRYGPRVTAFLGKSALAAMTRCSDIQWGRQSAEFGGTEVWVLPNPSGLNRNFTLAALVSAYAELRLATTDASSTDRHRRPGRR